MTLPALIYAADGNRRLAQIALDAGYLYGARSGTTYYRRPDFLDLDHRRPEVARHLAEVARVQPRYAVAGDATTPAELESVLETAERLREYAQHVIVVPKAAGMVAIIPTTYVVGLSVPTRFGATQAPYWEYAGRRLHLLGGSPQAQMRLWRYFSAGVVSLDGNTHMLAALRWTSTWVNGRWVRGERQRRLHDETGTGPDACYRAFERSCREIRAAWERLLVGRREETYADAFGTAGSRWVHRADRAGQHGD